MRQFYCLTVPVLYMFVMVATDTCLIADRALRWRKYSYEKRSTNEGRSDEAVDSSAILLRIRKVQVQILSDRPVIFNTAFRLFPSSLHTNVDITNSSEQSPSWGADRFQLKKTFLVFYGTQMFVTFFTVARHLYQTRARSIQSTLTKPVSSKSILILASWVFQVVILSFQ